MKTLDPAALKKNFADVRKLYTDTAHSNSVSILLQGKPGVGKTSTLLTSRRPILAYAFDPSYEALSDVRTGIEEGWLFVVLLNNENSNAPTEYKKFKEIATSHLNSGFLNSFGTIGIDVLTGGSGGLVEALANEIRKNPKSFGVYETKERPQGALFPADYQPLYDSVRSWIRRLQSTDAVLVCTAHTSVDKDDLTGRIVTDVDTFKGLRTMIPALFTERYHLTKETKGQTLEYKLFTNTQNSLDASTKIGKGKFAIEETPNIRELLKKAGLPAVDKPYNF